MKITSNAQCLFCQLWCFVRNMFLLRATISLSFFHLPLGNLNSTCVVTVTNTDTNIRLHSRVLIMSSGRTIVSDDDGAGSWLWECRSWSWLAPRHRQEHGHPPPADHWSPPHMVRWPHRPLSPRHTVSRCHHLHICFNQHTGSSLGINISDMRDYKWFESIKVMYSGEVVFIFSSFLMIFLFSLIPIPHPTKFSLRCLPNIMEDCFCQYH